MSLNKVKLLSKEQLIKAIEQSGNGNIADIVRDKVVDGQELIELTELKVISWKLTSVEKKQLFAFIEYLRSDPANFLEKYLPSHHTKADIEFKVERVKSVNNKLEQHKNETISRENPPDKIKSERNTKFIQELNSRIGHQYNLFNQSIAIPGNERENCIQQNISVKQSKNTALLTSPDQLPNSPRSLKDDGPIAEYDKTYPALSPKNPPKFKKKETTYPTDTILLASPDQLSNPSNVRYGEPKTKYAERSSSLSSLISKQREHFVLPVDQFHQKDFKRSSISNLRRTCPRPDEIAQSKGKSMSSLNQDFAQSSRTCTGRRTMSNEMGPKRALLKNKPEGSSLPGLEDKISSGLVVPQSPQNDKLSPIAGRKPIPLPTRGLPVYLDESTAHEFLKPVRPIPSPLMIRKNMKQSNDHKNVNIEQDESMECFQPKASKADNIEQDDSGGCFQWKTNPDEDHITTPKSTFFVQLEDELALEAEYSLPEDVDGHHYLSVLLVPDNEMTVKHHQEEGLSRKTDVDKKFFLDLSKVVKERFVQKEMMRCRVEDHSHLSLIRTPPSSDEEEYEQGWGNENNNVKVMQGKAPTRYNNKPLPRPPARMISPVFFFDFGDSDIDCEDEPESFPIDDPVSDPYYMNIDTKGTEQLMTRRKNGSFIFRPSEKFFLVLTIKHNNKLYNFGIDRADNGKIYLNGDSNSEKQGFFSLQKMVNYFFSNPITFMDGDEWVLIYINPFLGPDSFSVIKCSPCGIDLNVTCLLENGAE